MIHLSPRHRFTLSLTAAVTLFAATSPVMAQEWTRFRGPNGSGQSDAADIPSRWTDKDINWKIDLPGIGHSSPVIWGDKLFVASADPSNGTRTLFSIRTKDGGILWKKDYPAIADKIHVQNSFSSSTPACDADHVYFAWATPEEFDLIALDHNGKDVWRRNLGKFISRHGFGTSPIVYEDLIIITNDQEGESSLIALDRNSGETRWQIPRKTLTPQSASYATPMIYTRPGGEDELIVSSWGHGISSHNPRTGLVNWELPVFKLRPVGSPIMAGGLIWASCGEGAGTNSVVAVKPSDKPGPAQVDYESKPNSSLPYVPTMIAAGDLLFLWGDRGIVTCIDPRTRHEYWRKRIGGDYSASPIRIGDRIFGVSWQGQVVVLAAAREFQELARNDLGDETRATPAVADDTLFIRTQTKLMSIGGKKAP